jgi:hypothetical protein
MLYGRKVRRPRERVIATGSEARGRSTDKSVRTDLVGRVRREIAAGTYETPDKIDSAIDGLTRDLA